MKYPVIQHFNRGEVDKRSLARVDVKRVQESCSSLVNAVPSRLGPMTYRPGNEFILSMENADLVAHRTVGFVSAIDDTAILDFIQHTSDGEIQVVVNEEVMTGITVTSTINNGSFTSNITNWTDDSDGTASTVWYNWGTGDGALRLTGDGSSNARSYQGVVAETGKEHTLKISVVHNPVVLKLGITSVGDSTYFKGTLKPGIHYLSFTPTANFYITFENSKKYSAYVDYVRIHTTDLTLPMPDNLYANLDSLRTVQSIDVLFCAFDGGQQFEIEHRGDKSWSMVYHRANDGPFRTINTENISMSASNLSGDSTIIASEDYFKPEHVGALMQLVSTGQQVTAIVSVEAFGTNSVHISGTSTERNLYVVVGDLTGTGTTVTLQRSIDDYTWSDVESYIVNTTKTYNDTFSNTIYHYRLFIKSGDYSSGDIALSLTVNNGSIMGIARIYRYLSETDVAVHILQDMGSTGSTLDWYEGEWSDYRGWPSTVEIAEGRVFYARKDKYWGTVSDAYFSHDQTIEGDSKAISGTIGSGPEASAKWLKNSNQLVMGSLGREIAIRSSNFGELLTQSTKNVKTGSTRGSANVEPEMLDTSIIFVHRSQKKAYSLDTASLTDKFVPTDMMLMHPDIAAAGIKRIAVSMQPETRIYFVLNDGTMLIYTVDASEEVAGWCHVTRDDPILDVIVLPGEDEDRVYTVIGFGALFYLEKMAKFTDCVGGSYSHTFDSYIKFTSPGTAVLTGLSHLNGRSVGVWADGSDIGDYVVSSNQITINSGGYTDIVVGIRYTADYISNILDNYAKTYQLSQRKRIVSTALVAADFQYRLITVGSSSSNLKPLPEIIDGKTATQNTISQETMLPFEYGGDTEADPRIHIRMTGPATIMALVYGLDDDEDEATNKTSAA